MFTRLRRAVLLGSFAVCLACNDGPTAPSRPVVLPPPAPPLPPLSGASTTYSFSAPLEKFGVSAFTEHSSFVLYESGDFYLQYEAFAHQYRGKYERDAERITFSFSRQGFAADAIGTIKADLLEVRYSAMMQQSDFENAVYKRVE